MGEYIADSVYIGSLYPGHRQAISKPFGSTQRRQDGTTTVFRLKPVPKGGKPFVLEVSDMFQHERDHLNARAWKMSPVECGQLADNLVNEWAGNIPGLPPGAFPGIMRIIGTTPQQAEVVQMKQGLTLYFEYYFLEGERTSKIKPDAISEEHRLAADWLGRPTEWSHPARLLESMPCPFCRTQIPADSYVCSKCTRQIKTLPPDLAAIVNAPIVNQPQEEKSNVLSTV